MTRTGTKIDEVSWVEALYERGGGRVLRIFNTKARADKVASKMRREGYRDVRVNRRDRWTGRL